MPAHVISTTLCTALVAVLVASNAFADVTIEATTTGTGVFAQGLSGPSTTYIKGGKLRADSTVGNRQQSTILDVDAQQMIILDHDKKEATIRSMAEIQSSLQKITSNEIEVSLTPTGKKRQIAGETCEEYQLDMSVPLSADASTPMMISTKGPACIVPDAPGARDYEAFYLKAAEQGFILSGDPRQAERSPGHARSMTEMYRQMAKVGVPYEVKMSIELAGEGGVAALMRKVGGMSITTTVKRVTAGPLDDELFTVPSDYKVKKE